HIDPAAIDLTPLVNTLINSSQSGSRQLFSLLSVTSYSSLALHKLTLLVYNSKYPNLVLLSTFRRRFCYCVTNDTNDLTDFTAVLLDVMGNSTSSLHELFKSASIVSVSQRNSSDCIYICVMAGKLGKLKPGVFLLLVSSVSPTALDETAAQPLETAGEPTPVMPQAVTVQGVMTTAQTQATQKTTTLQEATTLKAAAPTTTQASTVLTRLTAHLARHTTSTVHPTAATLAWRTTRPLSRTTTTSRSMETERPGTGLCLPGHSLSGGSTTLGAHKLQPCVLELCKFFSQCLCSSHKTRMKRYCDDSHPWYQKHTSEVCRRVRRVSFSRSKYLWRTPVSDPVN
uniref:HERV-H LTR-associating 1 n=1 Tax=Mastacembelus armatus TaxID=205130 RepID=A0A3Q3MR05_9TELE